MKSILIKLYNKKTLDQHDIEQAMHSMLNENDPIFSAAFLSLLSQHNVKASELACFAQYLKQHMNTLKIDGSVLDIVGTGGDGQNTLNISTPSAILASSCGAKIIKHGNRSSSSLCGSSDVIEQLGFKLQDDQNAITSMFKKTGFGYCFAPYFHLSLATIKPIRKQLGIPTVFNLLGPLLNPANAQNIILGVYKKSLMPLFADTLITLGINSALVIHGNGTDEITTAGPTHIIEIKNGQQQHFDLSPSDFGIAITPLSAIKGGDARFNANAILACFKGDNHPLKDTLALNAGCALYISGVTDSINKGVSTSLEALRNGCALEHLNTIIKASHDTHS